MLFEVPQFIDVEDKIFGPLTFKQFVYVAGGVGFAVVMFLLVPFFFVVLLAGPVLLLSAALAFYKINDRPFIQVVESAFYYFINKRLYVWKKQNKKIAKREDKETDTTPYVPKLSENKLKDLSWSLDIKESLYGDDTEVKVRKTEKPKIEFEL